MREGARYVAAFMRASNAVHDVPEGRPIGKTLPIRVGVTAVVGLMLVISAAIVIFTGDLARVVGSAAVTTWSIVKWPVLISLMFAILYWASLNAKTGRFRRAATQPGHRCRARASTPADTRRTHGGGRDIMPRPPPSVVLRT